MAALSTAEARVFLHIGEPKTGTTFIQQVLWSNRAELAAQGVVLPGHHPQDHFRASQDLRGIEKLASDPAGPWTGEWEILASQAKQPGKTAVISHELFSAADPGQAANAVRSLQPAQVHVALTVRDMATLLPAEWQETVKHRNARSWEDWLSDVIDRESVDADRRQWWFWRVHDTLAILRLWAEHVPPERIHVITNPPHGSAAGLLWERFASLLSIDPACADLSRARPNASLGMAETEFLRRLNQALPGPDEVPDWFYMWNVKETVAHRALAGRGTGAWYCPPSGTPGPRNSPRPSSAAWAPAATRSPEISTTCARHRSRSRRPARRTSRPRRSWTRRSRPRRPWWSASTSANTQRPGRGAAAGWRGGSRPPPRPRPGSSGPCASSAAATRQCAACGCWPGGRWSASGHEGTDGRRPAGDRGRGYLQPA